jgi:hypothetical protein
LVHFVLIWVHFFSFWHVVPRIIWQPRLLHTYVQNARKGLRASSSAFLKQKNAETRWYVCACILFLWSLYNTNELKKSALYIKL